jgi:small subunit ribosomal protein S9
MAESSTYTQAVGRRKTSVARVRLSESPKTSIHINEKSLNDYFPQLDLQRVVNESILASNHPTKFKITVKVQGGGIHSQAEAIRHAISRALIVIDPQLRKPLKKEGYLKRDPRSKERRKFGLKKARKAPQWSKR